MADDFANRILGRKLGVGVNDRPTPDDIEDLARRQAEHAKRTQPVPKEPFATLLERQQHKDRGDGASQEEGSMDDAQDGASEPTVGGVVHKTSTSPQKTAPTRPPQNGNRRFIKA